MLRQIEFATTNKYKIKFANALLKPFGWECIPMKNINIVEPQDIPLKSKYVNQPQLYITMKKIEQALLLSTKKEVIAMDAGLFIEALSIKKPFPGILSKAIFDTLPDEIFLRLMEGEINRRAFIKQTIGWSNGIESKYFSSIAKGTIITSNELQNLPGFGWDRIFREEKTNKIMAEMTEEEKYAIWGDAWKKLGKWLNKIHNKKQEGSRLL